MEFFVFELNPFFDIVCRIVVIFMVKISFETHERKRLSWILPKIKWFWNIYLSFTTIHWMTHNCEFRAQLFTNIHFHSFITIYPSGRYEIQNIDKEWMYRVSDFIEFNKLYLLCQCLAIFRISRFFRIHATPHILFMINFLYAHTVSDSEAGLRKGEIHHSRIRMKNQIKIESIASCIMQFFAIEKLIMKCVFRRRKKVCRQM